MEKAIGLLGMIVKEEISLTSISNKNFKLLNTCTSLFSVQLRIEISYF